MNPRNPLIQKNSSAHRLFVQEYKCVRDGLERYLTRAKALALDLNGTCHSSLVVRFETLANEALLTLKAMEIAVQTLNEAAVLSHVFSILGNAIDEAHLAGDLTLELYLQKFCQELAQSFQEEG